MRSWNKKKGSYVGKYFKSRFKYLLISLLLLSVLDPFLRGFRIFGISFLDTIYTLLLLSAIYAISDNKKLLTAGIIFVVPILVISWTNYARNYPALVFVNGGLSIALLIFVTISILVHVLKQERITKDTIYGAACVYLMLGVIWGVAFTIIELCVPGAFSFGDSVMAVPDLDDQIRILNDVLMYYSYVTLTTVGYGDIVPVSPSARTFSALEAIVGQLYLVLLIARLVGLHISQSSKKGQ